MAINLISRPEPATSDHPPPTTGARISGRKSKRRDRSRQTPARECNSTSLTAFGVLLLLANLMVAGPWAAHQGMMLLTAGALMMAHKPSVHLPACWRIAAWLAAAAALTAFLPAAHGQFPEWRRHLESLGVDSGPLRVVQWRQAAESLSMLVFILLGGLWLTCLRTSPARTRSCAALFVAGVAVYAILAWWMREAPPKSGDVAHYGFFPNRNHTATYLAMGAVCGLGSALQALREKRPASCIGLLMGSGVCFWALCAWSVSRGGVILAATGCLGLVSMVGIRYLGTNGLRAIGLLALAIVGGFLIADSGVKRRISQTMDRAEELLKDDPATTAQSVETNPSQSVRDLDFRLPTALDTLAMIRDQPWSGVGAGQFRHVFPQYRKLASTANETDSYHPESDWLWAAAENGVPSTAALAALILCAGVAGARAIRHGHDRALRAGCLAAAAMVPIHGLFDVPGHRISLAWSAALLFSLALQNPSLGMPEPAPRGRTAWRIAGAVMAAAGCWLIAASWWGAPQPALMQRDTVWKRVRELAMIDEGRKEKAHAAGENYQPDPAQDPLEEALRLLAGADATAPLDAAMVRLRGSVALQFDDKQQLVRQCFQRELILDPYWVQAPLRQAAALCETEAEAARGLVQEALRRADRLPPGNPWCRQRTLEHLRYLARGKPALAAMIPEH